MPILSIIIKIAVIGLILFLVNKYVPMENTIKSILNVVVIILTILWLLGVFGLNINF
jgi:hypothetical protein